jgi:IclR family acetate operon transcriptional repressor
MPQLRAAPAGSPVRSVSRALSLLRVMAGSERSEWSLLELCNETGLPKATAHRMLNTMIDEGFVEHALTPGYYRLGLEAAVVGYASLQLRKPERVVDRILLDLSDRLREMVGVTLLSGTSAVAILRTHPQDRHPADLSRGMVLPAHVSCGGKLLLAAMTPDEVIAAYRGRTHLRRYTPNTITRLPYLLRHLELIRRQGYAIDDEEYVTGVRCVGVPIPQREGRVRYGVGLSAPATRASMETLRIAVRILQKAALELSPHVGGVEYLHGAQVAADR